MDKVVVELKPLSAAEVKTNVKVIQEILEKVMIKDVHYGRLPGCGDKPTLLKAGAEKIMSTFRLSADPLVDDLSTADCARYRVTLRLLAIDGTFCGAGIGEASTNEEKYKWRKAVCKEEFNDTPEDKCRIKYGKDGSKTEQVRTQPADLANTVLKMAKKRAQVDAVLTATAASDLFEQDLDDLDPDLIQHGTAPTGKPTVAMPQAKVTPQVSDSLPTQPLTNNDNFAKEVVDEFSGVQETEYFTVSQAQQLKVGDSVGIKAKVIGVYSKKVGVNKDKNKTDYLVTDGTNKIYIGMFGGPVEGVQGQECFFTGVKVGVWNEKQTYLCEGEVCPC